jgi:hypothetical protein
MQIEARDRWSTAKVSSGLRADVARMVPNEQARDRVRQEFLVPVFGKGFRPAPIGSFSGRKSCSLD